MKKTLIGLLVLLMVGGFVALAQAAESENVTVRVTITTVLDITVVSGGLIVFPSMDPGADAVVVSSSTVISNSGGGIDETYKMHIETSPNGWTAGASAGSNTYVLKAAFHGSQPTPVAFDTYTNTLDEGAGNALTAASDTLTIDASMTGASVSYGEDRTIWYKFQPPSTSTLTGTLDITVTITAIAS